MDILERIRFLMDQRNWSEYKLAKLSGIPQSTINSMFKSKNNPSIYTLKYLCEAFNISLCDFFREVENQELVDDIEYQALHEKWELLSKEQQIALLSVIDSMIK